MANGSSSAFLLVSHHGGAGDLVRASHGHLRLPALAWKALRTPRRALGAAVELSSALHRKHRWLADCRTRPAALVDLWAHANQRRLLEDGFGRKRFVYSARIHGIVRIARIAFHGLDVPRDQPRACALHSGAGTGTHRRAVNPRKRSRTQKWVFSGFGS